ncbi:MAG: hypothetical protein ACERLG_04590, partial [Sedimentibacter sp.]
VITLSGNMLIFGTKSQALTVKEYSVQSELRIAVEKTNELVRYSKAIFAVPEPFIASESVMDPGWNYLMVSPDEKKIVIMKYDDSLKTHVENVVVDESEGLLYGLSFNKDETANGDTILKYEVHAYNSDDEGNKTNEKIAYETTVETLNAIQVVDKGTEASPSIALAFRSDGETSGKGENEIAYITIIVDTSGSMNEAPDGSTVTNKNGKTSRIDEVISALIGDGSSNGTGIIQSLAKEENVFVSLVPFATTANSPFTSANSKPDELHPFYEVYNSDESTTLRGVIGSLNATGGTNTGDGLRRAYYLHNTFRTRMSAAGMPIDAKDQVHHYIILLVDGETTYETKNYKYEDNNGYYTYSGYRENISGTNYYRFDWNTGWASTEITGFLPDGNIALDYLSSYSPGSETLKEIEHKYGLISYVSGRNYYNYTGNYVKYGEKNDSVPSKTVITGTGSSTISNSQYIASVGSAIEGFDDSAGIRSYLIGYASGLTTNIKYIGDEIGTEDANRYVYNSTDFDLDEIFKNIATDIMADYWLAAGPQIVK